MLALRHSEIHLRARGFSTTCRSLMAAIQSQPEYAVQSEYTEEPIYPKIKDLSFKTRKRETAAEWHEAIRKLNTVEEKIIKINMPRYYGYKTIELSDEKLPYNCLPAIQHYTRTHFEEVPLGNISTTTADIDADQTRQKQQLDSFLDIVKPNVQEALEMAYDFYRKKYDNISELEPVNRERAFTEIVIEQINRALINTLSADCTHLQEVEIETDPRHEAFWSVGGITPPKNFIKCVENRKFETDFRSQVYNRWMQYRGKPYLTLRHEHQLKPWKSESEVNNLELAKQIPRFDFDPRTLGYLTGHRHGTNIPGFWPGSENVFGTLSYQSRAHMLLRPTSCGDEDMKEALHAQGIQSSYAWLLAQANYNGFNTFNELTYPMNTQTIISDGRLFSFYEYQLNTLLVHSHHVDENPLINYCRGTKELPLYAEFNDSGHVVDLNESVLRQLIKFYINSPDVIRTNRELQPYLHPEIKYASKYEDEEKRDFLEKTFKHICSNRPRHLALPEIYLWQKIYKIDHNTRPMDAKRLFFELNINPWKRTLDQHQKEYIPKRVRPEGPKSKKKFKPTFYP